MHVGSGTLVRQGETVRLQGSDPSEYLVGSLQEGRAEVKYSRSRLSLLVRHAGQGRADCQTARCSRKTAMMLRSMKPKRKGLLS